MGLNEFDFDIIYRSEKMNNTPDALSRDYFASIHDNTLHDIYNAFCHSASKYHSVIPFCAR